VERLSSFEDRVHPATDVALRLRVPFSDVRSATALTADANATAGKIPFTIERAAGETWIAVTLPKLELSTILVFAL
jgi:hypothetical protein